jgi:hypothetical protein
MHMHVGKRARMRPQTSEVNVSSPCFISSAPRVKHIR